MYLRVEETRLSAVEYDCLTLIQMQPHFHIVLVTDPVVPVFVVAPFLAPDQMVVELHRSINS